MRLQCAVIALACSSAIWPRTVLAQQDAKQQATALFDKGKALFEQHRYAEACDALATSEKLDAAVGTLGLLAACHEEIGKTATAYREYVETAERASLLHDDREKYARERANMIRPTLAVLTIRTQRAEADINVTRDGELVQLGAPAFVDPGRHAISARAPGKKEWHTEAVVEPAHAKEIVVPPLEADAGRGERSLPSRATPPPSAPSAGESGSGKTMVVAGAAALGVGAAAAAVGAIAGGVAWYEYSDLKDSPGCPDACADAGRVDSYHTTRTVSTVGFVVGGIALAAGTLLLLSAPHAKRRSASVATSAPAPTFTAAGVALF